MTSTPTTGSATAEFLVRAGRFLTPGDGAADSHSVTRTGGRQGDVVYRDRGLEP